MGKQIRNVVVLGANGAMGSGSGAVFAAAGIPTVFLARTKEKAEAGRTRAESMVKSTAISRFITTGSYDDLDKAVAGADLVFEAVAEDLETKKTFFARVDKARKPDAIVATVSSGLSIAAMCAGQSEGFRKHFLGIHFFNPPTMIVGCELIPHAGTDAAVTSFVRELLAGPLGREVIETADTPAFAGNRVGFKVLNEVAQLAEQHGVAFMDQLLGPHTGRALAPLATIDLVGWDVHKAIVDHLYEHTGDESFKLPAYMQRGIDLGHLGRKTRDKGGFFKMDKDKRQYVLDPKTFEYHPRAEVAPVNAFVEKMQAAGGLDQMMDLVCTSPALEAELLRRVFLGYISYGLGLVGTVVAQSRDVDRIMGFGFAWAPPSMLVDAIGPARTATLLDKHELPVPAAVTSAAQSGIPLHVEANLDRARFFKAA